MHKQTHTHTHTHPWFSVAVLLNSSLGHDSESLMAERDSWFFVELGLRNTESPTMNFEMWNLRREGDQRPLWISNTPLTHIHKYTMHFSCYYLILSHSVFYALLCHFQIQHDAVLLCNVLEKRYRPISNLRHWDLALLDWFEQLRILQYAAEEFVPSAYNEMRKETGNKVYFPFSLIAECLWDGRKRTTKSLKSCGLKQSRIQTQEKRCEQCDR